MFRYENLKKIIFKLDPEQAHHITEIVARGVKYCPLLNNYLTKKNFIVDDILMQNVFGRTFYNPVGLGAGFDKNATLFASLPMVGFGFSEVGTITPLPQAGNAKPRLFRFPEVESIQNAMGFNNDGMEIIAKRVEKRYPFTTPLGINIGKNKITSQENTILDYEKVTNRFKDIADFFIVNISSPNTPGLRDLQNEEFIGELLTNLKKITKKDILIKIAPDIQIQTALNLVETSIKFGASGIIANNTSNDYSILHNAKKVGGLSGKIIKEKSAKFFSEIAKEFFGKTILISVGGIDTADEAYKRIKAGATLVEVFSALIFKGPSLIREINLGVIQRLKADGFLSIKDAIGADYK